MDSQVINNIGSAVLRISFAISLLIIHGWDKLLMVLTGDFDFPDPLGIGPSTSLVLLVIAEFICPIMVIVGFKTRHATIPVIISMLVAMFVFHSGDPFEVRELAYVYAMAFVSIFFLGGGRYSIDFLLHASKT